MEGLGSESYTDPGRLDVEGNVSPYSLPVFPRKLGLKSVVAPEMPIPWGHNRHP